MRINNGKPVLDATWDVWEQDVAHTAAAVRNTGACRVLSAEEVAALLASGAITPVTQIKKAAARPMYFGGFMRGAVDPRIQGDADAI